MPSSSLTPNPPSLLRVPESQAISNSSSFISSASSSLFDRLSGASSGCLTDFSSPFTPSTAEFGCKEGESMIQPSDSPTCLSSPQILLDRACALGTRSSVRSSEDFDAIAILRNRLERGNPSVLARRALALMDSGVQPLAAGVRGSVEAPVTEELSTSDGDIDDEWLDALEIAVAHSSIIFPSASDRSLFDEQDIAPSSCSFVLPSKPVLAPVTSLSPCSPFILGTPELSFNREVSSSSLFTLMEESPSSSISSPVNLSIDEEEIARIMHTVISIPTRSRQPFSGSPHGDVDVATVMHLEIASTFSADRPHRRTSQPRTLIGLGVAMPVIYPPLPPALFPYHHSPGATLNSRSLRELGYPFDDKMFETEQNSLALLSRRVNVPSMPENVGAGCSGLSFENNEWFDYSPIGGCIVSPEIDSECSDALQVEQALPQAHTPLNHTLPIVFGKALVGLGLGLGDLTEASVESQPPPTEPSPTIGRHHLVSADESVTEMEVALPPVSDFYLQAQNSLKFFEPLGVQKTIELDASQLERQSALYNLERADFQLDHIFSYSPPIRLEQRTEIERQLLADLFKKQSPKSPNSFESQLHSSSFSTTPPFSIKQGHIDLRTVTTNTFVEVEQPRSVKDSAVSNKRGKFAKRSYQTLKKLGLERLAIFHPRSARDDLDLTSPTVAPQNDPRSPPPPPLTSEARFQSSKNMQIGLGLPSRVIRRRLLRMQETSSQGSINNAVRHQSRGSSQEECQNPSLIVTHPSMVSFSRVQSVQVSNQFLKPSHFPERPLYDIVEVPTPPSSTFSFSPRGTVSPRNQWSSPFVRLNPPQKKRSSRSQASTPSTDSPSSIHSEREVGTTDVVVLSPPADVVVTSPEVSVTPAASVRPGFKQFISKFTRGLFKHSRSLKISDPALSSSSSSSPVLIVHADAPTGLGLLQDDHGVLCDTKENGFTSSISVHNLQLLF